MTTLVAGTVATFTTRTVYSSCDPGSAAPPPTTATDLVITSCWPSPTTTIVGSGPVRVNSSHHQSVDPERVAEGFAVSAWAPDGTAEALELLDRSRLVLGVQWHPELMVGDGPQQRLFGAFVDACRDAS